MNWKTQIKAALGPGIDEDVLEELAQHAAATYASARADGGDAADAQRRVTQQIHAWAANPALLRRRPKHDVAVVPPAGSASPLAAIAQDTRYAWRLLRRQPAYAALVVATMALGIAATTVLGSVAYGVLLKPLPWADAPRLVRLYENRQGSTRRFRPMMTNGTYLPWRDASSTLDAIGGWTVDRVVMPGQGTTGRIGIGYVTPSLLPMLRAEPALGRTFLPGEDDPSRPPAIVLSFGLWQERFGGRGDVLGQTLRLDDTNYTVVGVMPATFAFPDRETRAWLPYRVRPVTTPGQDGFYVSIFQAIGRLRPGATVEQAAAEGTARGRAAPDRGPVTMAVFGSNGPVDVSVVPLMQALTGEVKPAILVLLAAVVLLLVTATANVASLQLARATSRRRELAIRAALGAARGRLVRQTLVENLVLGLLGGAAGLALAAVMHRALPAVLPVDFPRLDDLALDYRIQAFAIAVSIAAGLGCGLLPALQIARHELVPALGEDSLAPVGGGLRARTGRVRALIMTGQVAIACVLLVGALLLVRSFIGMMNADIGYDAGSVLTARAVLPDADYTPERRLQAVDQILQRLAATPGVTRAAFTTAMPFTGGEALSSFPLKQRDGSTVQVQTGSRQVSAGYFAAIGQKLIEGREFTGRDTRTSQIAVIVNREFARKYLDGRALGWSLPGDHNIERPIVGVVGDTARRTVTDTPQPEIYYASGQRPLEYTDLYLVVRTTGEPRRLAPSLRSIVRDVAPQAPLESIVTLEDRVADTLSRPRLYAVLLGTFAAFALAIAGVGLFGVLSYTVAQRAREIGVRSALGAQMRDIIGLIVGQAMAIAGAGVAIGLVASYWLTGALQKFLYGVTPHDAVSFGVVAAVLLLVSILASIVPARRAARVDPVKVLRS
ncbi:MAG TPA: ABC transporter permease [Vicinamibacterales bacterium]|nr:ABC transporter permease [Vicinamibacterales bacterium]